METNIKNRKLREIAEHLLKQKDSVKTEKYIHDIEKLVEELNIHQIELEMQNDELQNFNDQLVIEQKKYKDLYMDAPTAYFTLNKTGNIIELNHAAANLLKIQIHVFKNTSIFPYLEEQSKRNFTKYFQQVFNSNQVEYGSIVFINSDNELVYTHLSSKTYIDNYLHQKLVRCTVIDQTQMLKYESEIENQKKIAQAKELYLKIFEDFPALIWRSRLDKLCDYFNKTWLDFTGRTMEQEFGNGWAESVHPDDFNDCLQTYVSCFEKREAFVMEYRMTDKTGEYRWIRDFGRPFYDLDNSFLGYIGSCYDITENKNNELNLVKLNATKDKFFSILAHDLRSPFTAILGFSNLLMNNLEKIDKNTIRNYIESIYDSSKSAYNLLENLLEWAKAQSNRIVYFEQKLSLLAICQNAIEYFSLAAMNKKIKLSNDFTEDIILLADENMLNTIVRNLISNAIKFTHTNGAIKIIAQKTEKFATISISDNGVGIPTENLETLFDISQKYSTKGTNNEPGTGLGLVLCKEFVEKIGGTIRVESQLDKGSEFIFTVPLANS